MNNKTIVPGLWQCPKCNFILCKSILSVAHAEVLIDTDMSREVCPNDGVTLEPVSE